MTYYHRLPKPTYSEFSSFFERETSKTINQQTEKQQNSVKNLFLDNYNCAFPEEVEKYFRNSVPEKNVLRSDLLLKEQGKRIAVEYCGCSEPREDHKEITRRKTSKKKVFKKNLQDLQNKYKN
jgi:hypothetical protein